MHLLQLNSESSVGFLIIAAGVFLAIGMNGLKKYQGEYRPDIAHLGFGKPQAGQTSTMANMGDSVMKTLSADIQAV